MVGERARAELAEPTAPAARAESSHAGASTSSHESAPMSKKRKVVEAPVFAEE